MWELENNIGQALYKGYSIIRHIFYTAFAEVRWVMYCRITKQAG